MSLDTQPGSAGETRRIHHRRILRGLPHKPQGSFTSCSRRQPARVLSISDRKSDQRRGRCRLAARTQAATPTQPNLQRRRLKQKESPDGLRPGSSVFFNNRTAPASAGHPKDGDTCQLTSPPPTSISAGHEAPTVARGRPGHSAAPAGRPIDADDGRARRRILRRAGRRPCSTGRRGEDRPAQEMSSPRTPACLAIPRRAGGTAMHEPLPHRTAVQADVAVAHVLCRDIETRSHGQPEEGRRAQVRGRSDDGSSGAWHMPSTTAPCSCGARAIRCRRNSSKLRRIRAGVCSCAQRRFRNRH